MAKQKQEAPTSEAPVEAEAEVTSSIVVETHSEVEDMNATAEKSSDPYAKEVKVDVVDNGTGIVVENYS